MFSDKALVGNVSLPFGQEHACLRIGRHQEGGAGCDEHSELESGK